MLWTDGAQLYLALSGAGQGVASYSTGATFHGPRQTPKVSEVPPSPVSRVDGS
jgi:hypothetical protein